MGTTDRSTPRPLASPLTGVVLAVMTIASGCAPSERADLVIGNGPEIESFDPGIVTDVAGVRLLSALFEGLTAIDPETGRAIPATAASFETSDDGCRIRFHLREEARFSDGRPVTADDVVFTWRRLVDPRTGASSGGFLLAVDGAPAILRGDREPQSLGVRAVDRHELEVTLEHPDPGFLLIAAHPALAPLPAHVIRDSGAAGSSASPFRPGRLVGNGPYRLVSSQLRYKTRLAKNPHYWNRASVAIDTVDFLSSDGARTLCAFYFQGDADWVTTVPPELAPSLAARPDYRASPYLGTCFIRFNTTRAPLDDPRVRRALASAIDRGAIVERILNSGEIEARGLVPTFLPGYPAPDGLPHDPRAARDLLARAGYPGGAGFPGVTFVFNGTEENRAIASILQSGWKQELGIDVELAIREWKVLITDTRALEYDLARSSWIADIPDAANFLAVFRSRDGNNRTGWSSSRYDELLESAARARQPQERSALLAEAEALLLEEAPLAPLYHYASRNLVSPRILGFTDNPLDLHPLTSLRLAPVPDRARGRQ